MIVLLDQAETPMHDLILKMTTITPMSGIVFHDVRIKNDGTDDANLSSDIIFHAVI